MIAPKSAGDTAHKIKIEMAEEREDVENRQRCLQNGDLEGNGNDTCTEDHKRKRSDQNRDRTKRRQFDEN